MSPTALKGVFRVRLLMVCPSTGEGAGEAAYERCLVSCAGGIEVLSQGIVPEMVPVSTVVVELKPSSKSSWLMLWISV